MDNEKHLKSNVISLILHILIIWALFSLKSAHILTPSRSDGIEVSLISSDDLPQPAPPVVKPVLTPEPIKTVDNTADINLNQPQKEQSKPAVKPVAPPIVKPIVPPPPVAKPITPPQKKTNKSKPNAHKKRTNSVTDSLLSQLDNPENSGRSRGKAVGGIQSGTSDSNVMVSNYADAVISAVRPYVDVPEGIDSSATAVVKVVLLPNMKVYQVDLKRSSGNSVYDNNVQEAIKRLAVFPPLPDGAKFVDFRVLYLTFQP